MSPWEDAARVSPRCARRGMLPSCAFRHATSQHRSADFAADVTGSANSSPPLTDNRPDRGRSGRLASFTRIGVQPRRTEMSIPPSSRMGHRQVDDRKRDPIPGDHSSVRCSRADLQNLQSRLRELRHLLVDGEITGHEIHHRLVLLDLCPQIALNEVLT
jgi:hypothetical protein